MFHCVPVSSAAAEQSLTVGVFNVRSLGNKSTGRRARHHRRSRVLYTVLIRRRRQLAARLGRVAERRRHSATALRRRTCVLDREPLQPA